ncbi:MAG: hypothetical protein DRI32_09395 [Chloroflexi bacterium]|nr:MAG: hypothetical protein DRI32_09395 [Chloroflexota bacterium]
MRPKQLEELLQQDESVSLEYKTTLNLRDKAGKAKFLKEVLSLANSLQGRAYLVIGVREKDKKKEIVGMEGITEEQIQSVIKEWCRPAIDFHFEIVPFDEKNVGVITIYSNRPPHTVKKRFGYPKTNKTGKHIKQNYLEEHEVFVRKGSTIEIASPEEIVAMAQRDSDGLDAVVSRLDRIADWQEETAEAIYSQNRANRTDWKDNWFAVPILIALITGAVIGWWWLEIPKDAFPIVSGVISIFILCVFSIFDLSEISVKQALWTIAILSFIFWGAGRTNLNLALALPISRILYGCMIGVMGGLVTSILTVF